MFSWWKNECNRAINNLCIWHTLIIIFGSTYKLLVSAGQVCYYRSFSSWPHELFFGTIIIKSVCFSRVLLIAVIIYIFFLSFSLFAFLVVLASRKSFNLFNAFQNCLLNYFTWSKQKTGFCAIRKEIFRFNWTFTKKN